MSNSNLNRPNFNAADSAAQVNIILLTVGLGLGFACCLCVYRRCYPRYDEFTTLRNDDSDFMPILVGSPLGMLSPLHTVAAGTVSFFGSIWKSLFGKRKKTKKKSGGFLNNPFMDRFMSPEARERLYALAQVDTSDLPESSSTTRRAETVAAKEAKAKAKAKVKAKPPLTASNYFDTDEIDIDIESTPLKQPTAPLPAVPTPTVFSPTFRQVIVTHPLPFLFLLFFLQQPTSQTNIFTNFYSFFLHCFSESHFRSLWLCYHLQYIPPANDTSSPSPPTATAGSKNITDDKGRTGSSTRDESYPEQKGGSPPAAASSMWDWSQFTTNTSPFKDKGSVQDKIKGKNKDKDKSVNSGLFESSRREATRLRYVTFFLQSHYNHPITSNYKYTFHDIH